MKCLSAATRWREGLQVDAPLETGKRYGSKGRTCPCKISIFPPKAELTGGWYTMTVYRCRAWFPGIPMPAKELRNGKKGTGPIYQAAR